MARPTVRVEGIREFQAALRKADRLFPRELRKCFNEVAEPIADEAAQNVPVRTGALRSSIRPLSTQREGRVAMGYESRVPYAGWIEFGGTLPSGPTRPFVKAGRYLFPVPEQHQGRIQKSMERVLNRLASSAGLD